MIRSLVAAVAFFSLSVGLSAQCSTCVPDETCSSPDGFPTMCPAELPHATVGEFYEEPVTFFMPTTIDDPGSGVTATLLEIHFTNVYGIPFGMQYTINDADSIYHPVDGENYGCATICGTPVLPGVYNVTVVVDVLAQAFGIEVNQTQSFTQVFVVDPGPGGTNSFSYDVPANCGSLQVQFDALLEGQPNQLTTYYWDFDNGQTSNLPSPGVITYDAVGDYQVILTTSISDYTLNQVNLDNIGGNWGGDIEDFFGEADPFFEVVNGSGATVYTSASASDVTSYQWTGLNVVLNDPPYSLIFWDEDVLTQNDNLGTVNFDISIGNSFVSGNGNSAELVIGTSEVNHIVDTAVVSVFPIPDASFGVNGNTLVCTDQNLLTYTWTVENVVIDGANGPSVALDLGGNYQVFVTNEFGCSAESDTYLYCPEITPVFNPASDLISVPANQVSYQWYFNGLPLDAATDYFINNPENGNYAVEIVTPYGCTVMSEVTTVFVGISELVASEWNMYPNPANELVHFTWANGVHAIQVYNSVGQLVAQQKLLAHENSITVDHLPKGIYSVKVTDQNGRTGLRNLVIYE